VKRFTSRSFMKKEIRKIITEKEAIEAWNKIKENDK